MQRTINVNGDKIKIVSRRMWTRQGNFNGWLVIVNGIRYSFPLCLYEQVAREEAFVLYIKEYR